jgi:hypothetical protein
MSKTKGDSAGMALPGLRAAPFPVDVRRLVFDVAQTFNPLASGFSLDMRVSPARDGHVLLTVALPEGMTRVFMALLDSMHGLVQVIDSKSRASFAEARAVDLDELDKARRYSDAFRAEVCRLFDELVNRGESVKDAVKQVNRALKDAQHPWASVDLVARELRAAGRLKRAARSQRV